MTTFASFSRDASHSVETSQRLASFSSAIDASSEGDAHATVLLALLFDLRHAHRADFAGAAHMRAAAGLQVKAVDFDQPDATRADRRLHRHWAEGPAYFPAQRRLIWSDIPNNRLMSWNEVD